MADSSEPVSKRLRRGRSANEAKTSTPQPQQPIESPQKISSKSLSYLNDACLRELFERLDIESLCQMANVCKRFRPITQEVFNRQHKEFVFQDRKCKRSVFRRIMSKFGHLITSIDVSEADYGRRLDVNAIAKFCTNNNLKKIILQRASIDCDAFKSLFARLEDIDLIKCEFTGNQIDLFRNCRNLKAFGFYPDFFGPHPLNLNFRPSLHLVKQKFPKLECLGFDCNYIGFHTFFDLLALNPQLKHIDIFAQSEDMFIDAIAMFAKNLESFALHGGDSLPEEQTRRNFLKLSKMKKLQKLKLDAGYEIWGKSVGPLMDAFDKEKVPLSRLQLSGFLIAPNDIKSILKVKTIKSLVLDEIVKAVSDTDLVPLATQLPMLEHLQLNFGKKVKTPISVNGLAKMAKDGKQLQYIAFVGVENLKIDKKAFENILKAVQCRRNEKKLTIHIVGRSSRTTTFNVPENVQRAASAHLKIRYS